MGRARLPLLIVGAISMVMAAGFTQANAQSVSYSITNGQGAAGELHPGTLTGSFIYDPSAVAYSSASIDIEGVENGNLGGQYVLYTGPQGQQYVNSGGMIMPIGDPVYSDSQNLLIQNTSANSQGDYLDVKFASPLGSGSDQITSISSFGGNGSFNAYLSTPPTVAYAAPPSAGGGGGPEPSTWALMMVGVFGAGAALRRRKGEPGAALAI